MTSPYSVQLNQLWEAATAPGVRRTLEYPEITLPENLANAAKNFPQQVALEFFGRATSYRVLHAQVAAFAAALRSLGVKRGDCVALMMPNCPQHVVAFYATMSVGATVVEHNPLATTDELAPMFANHRAQVAIVWDSSAATLQTLDPQVRPATIISVNMIAAMRPGMRALLSLPLPAVRTTRASLSVPAPGTLSFSDLLAEHRGASPQNMAQMDDVALLLYTSGTTGEAKGVPLTHRNLMASGTQAVEWVNDLQLGEEIFMACLPFFHVFGASLSLNAAVMVAATIQLVPKPDATLMLGAMKRRRPTVMIAVPPVFQKLAELAPAKKASLQGIRHSISGAMPLNRALIDQWESLTGGYLIEGYGLSECSPIVAGNPAGPGRRAGSIGIPFPDTQVRLSDPEDPSRESGPGELAEILVKGPQVFNGYRNRPEETQRTFYEGWFRTGDVVRVDDEGYLHVADRIKELIITGGFNVYPSEVEAALLLEDGVSDAAVVGMRNAEGAEEVVAAVVLDGLDSLDPAVLRAHIKERLSAYKVPRRFIVLPELPRNAMGKVLRREVRTLLEKMAERTGKDQPLQQ